MNIVCLYIISFNNVIIESSSHGLEQNRLHHIDFKGAIFTNFSQDHLDYNKNMKSYLNAKLILFREILEKKKTIITDKEIKEFSLIKKISKKKSLKLLDISNEISKIKYELPDYVNDFKIKNIAMAIKAAKLCGLRKKIIYKNFLSKKNVYLSL